MPDLFFVRKERGALLTSKATLGAPDLVMELVSPNDRRSDITATEADYRSIGVAEIVYINQQKQAVRVLRKTDTGYDEEKPQNAPLTLRSLNISLAWDWLFTEPRPDTIDTVLALLQDKSERTP